MCGGAFFMILINKSRSFHSALFCMMMAMSLNALGNAGTPVTPQDMSPRFAGTLFGKFFFAQVTRMVALLGQFYAENVT